MSEPYSVTVLSWFRHRRTEEICRHFGWTSHVLETSLKGIPRYLVLTPRTLWTLLRLRPDVLLVQNPSLILTTLCVLLRPVFRYKLVVDAHNEAVTPYLFDKPSVRFAARQCLQRAAITIVTNESLAQKVRAAGGTPFVLPDAIPKAPVPIVQPVRTSPFTVIVISTFAKDEPLACVFDAARELGDLATFKVTGNFRKMEPELRARAPANVLFTGFLAETDYWVLLRDSGAVLDLTEMPDCLVCGAYEAVAVERPLILTDSTAAREWFGDAAIYVRNEPASVAGAVRELAGDRDNWDTRARAAKLRISDAWRQRAASLPEAMGATLQ
jgi:glycosyltransferase involved in cell wall biosynthesis